MIYFDQAATSFPKPQQVIDGVVSTLTQTGGNAGRGNHKTTQAIDTLVTRTRQNAAHLFGCSRVDHVLLFSSATVGLNQAIKGLHLQRGDHIIATHYEHNSVRRPLNYIQTTKGIDVSYMPVDWKEQDVLNKEIFKSWIRPETKMLVMTHGSNVTGSVLPIAEMASIAKMKGLLVLVDASQTAGHLPINMAEQNIDMLVMPGHKGLMGPQGTGLLLVGPNVDLIPLHHGGTGRYSETIDQPEVWPEKYESGTLNLPGIGGLNAALELYRHRPIENVPRETLLARLLLKAIKVIPNVLTYGPDYTQLKLPIVAFNVQNVDAQEIAMILDSHYDIAVRAGLHCSPLTHMALGTMKTGVVRASLGMYNTEEEVNMFVQSLSDIAVAYAEL